MEDEMHYSDRDVSNAIDEFRAGGDILPPEVFAHLTPAQLQRWESALHHEEMRIMRRPGAARLASSHTRLRRAR
jgi:hypothetical protein